MQRNKKQIPGRDSGREQQCKIALHYIGSKGLIPTCSHRENSKKDLNAFLQIYISNMNFTISSIQNCTANCIPSSFSQNM